MSTSQAVINAYWKPSYETLYDAYYQELASEALIGRWQFIHILIAFLVAATSSGSAIAGWALWSERGWKTIWAIIAAIASLASIAHGVVGVPSRVREQEEVRQLFCRLRIDVETFRHLLRIGITMSEAQSKYDELRNRYSECVGRTRPDIAFTIRLRKRVQDRLNQILKDRRVIK